MQAMASPMSITRTSYQTREQLKTGIANAMLAAVPFDEEATHLMDYACGSGAISQRLAPYCKRIVGIDINSKAVEAYNQRISDQGIPHEEMVAICADISQIPDILNHESFDIIVCSQAYHHFPSICKITESLVSFLKPGGHLLVADLLKNNISHLFHSHTHHDDANQGHRHDTETASSSSSPVVHHGGLTKDQILEAFQKADLTEIDFKIIHTIQKGNDKIEIFLIKGNKSPTSRDKL